MSTLGAAQEGVNARGRRPVDTAGDGVGTLRCVAVDTLVHRLWTSVWMTELRPVTCTNATSSCGRKKIAGRSLCQQF